MSEDAASAGPAASGPDAAETSINSQVLDAVRLLNDLTAGKDDAAAGTTIAYQQVAHAAALAIQDAVDYQRNALAICAAAQGKAYAMMAENPDIPRWGTVCGLAMSGSIVANVTTGMICHAAIDILKNFPRS